MLDTTTHTALTAKRQPFAVIEERPSISVIGLGYVGAVSTACLANLGHQVIGVDIDPGKVSAISSGQSPIHETGLGTLLDEGVSAGRITATNDLDRAVRSTDVTFVSVGTPTAEDGGCDIRYIETAARGIGMALRSKDAFHVVVMRCSIPPGTTLGVMARTIEEVSGKTAGQEFGVCFNPEFLREGVAIDDFHAPPKTVIGATDARSSNILARICAPVDQAPILTSIETAEMVKYVDNVWHAAKVCFANEVGRLCKSRNVDSHQVMDVFVQDTKLNLSSYYLRPGFAYGGSCLPKEVRAVAYLAGESGVSLPLIENLGLSNQEQIETAVRMVRETGATRVGILGLSFKPGTDDLRESPALEVIARLKAAGLEIMAHDPVITAKAPGGVQPEVRDPHGARQAALAKELGCRFADTPEAVTDWSDAIVVTQKNVVYSNVAQMAMEQHDTPVIDVVRAYEDCPTSKNYHGIGW